MNNYFRITAYHPKRNVCAIIDSNSRFEKLWQFSAYLIQKGFKIIEVGGEDKFLEGDFPKAPASDLLIVRACERGEPQRMGNAVCIRGKSFEVSP